VLHARRARYCVAVFVINEGARIIAQLDRMRHYSDDVDIVIADGGSTDGSLSDETLRSAGVRALLTKTGPGKLSAQMRMAFDWALREGYEGVITMDGNNKDDPAALPSFAQALGEGVDHIQGSRFVPGGRAINTPMDRWLAVRLLHAPLISLVAGVRYTDTTNGFRAYSRRFLLDPRVQPLRAVFVGYELHYYLAIRAGELGFKVIELPVTRAYPRGEPLPTKISPIKGKAKVLATLVRSCLKQYHPKRVPAGDVHA
jgi:dolichol-phosphate mannosyltransferase